MAITRVSTAVLFAAADSKTISAATQADSDAYTFDDTAIGAGIEVSASYAGAASSGDYVDVYAKYTTGDVLGDTGDDYETDEHATILGRLDLYGSNTPGENPVRKTFSLDPQSFKGLKLSYVAPNAATHNVVLRAMVSEKRAA